MLLLKEKKTVVGKEVWTSLGRGKIVHQFQDQTVVVEFEHGGGQIYHLSDLFPKKKKLESN